MRGRASRKEGRKEERKEEGRERRKRRQEGEEEGRRKEEKKEGEKEGGEGGRSQWQFLYSVALIEFPQDGLAGVLSRGRVKTCNNSMHQL